MKIIGYDYRVTGHGIFPMDMLRYDCAYPSGDGLESMTICHHDREDYMERRTVALRSHREPTAARWSSFGWTVTDLRPIRR